MSNVKAYLEDIVRDGLHDIAEALKGSSPIGDVQASHVSYDNETSGLLGTNAQEAIDELSTKVNTNASGISDLTTRMGTAEGNITSLDGRLDTAEGNITSLDGRLDTAEGDITALETWKDNLDASDIPYDSGTVKDALDHVSNIYVTAMKGTSGGSTVKFNIPNVPPSGYIEIIGDANTTAVLSIIPVHSSTIVTNRISHLTSATFTATFSDGVLTITGNQWWIIRAIASFPIS